MELRAWEGNIMSGTLREDAAAEGCTLHLPRVLATIARTRDYVPAVKSEEQTFATTYEVFDFLAKHNFIAGAQARVALYFKVVNAKLIDCIAYRKE